MAETKSSDSRREHVVRAATDVFLRYGYTRTTMNDIAKAASLTRPTLYQGFPDKEAVFTAVVDEMAVQLFAKIQEGLTQRNGLAERLRFACETWGAEGFALVQANPDAKDMFDLCFAPVKSSYIKFEKLLADLLQEPLIDLDLGVEAREVARIILFSIKGFKETARDVADMRRLIAAHTFLIARGIEGQVSERKSSPRDLKQRSTRDSAKRPQR